MTEAEPGEEAEPDRIYACVVYRDGAFRRKRQIDLFTTDVDPADPESLRAVLVLAISRDRGPADPVPYSMDVFDRSGALILESYRPLNW